MRNRRSPAVAAVLCVAMLPLAGCAAFSQFTANAFLMSVDKENELGHELSKQVEQERPLYTGDPAATAYVQALGERLSQAAPETGLDYRFQIVDSEEVNAFAIPGGACYVNVGLMRLADTEAELASVMAHEIGHAALRHGAKRISQSQFYGVLGQLALGEDAGALGQVAAGIVQSGMLLKHSREYEYEADAQAVRIMDGAGIDPNGLVSFFEKMQAGTGESEGLSFMSLLSTHPPTSERIEAVRGHIRNVGHNDSWSQNTPAFREVKQRFPLKDQQGG
jgi:beta-barrel assembly-enhancing protease